MPKVLIIDDDEWMLNTLCDQLQSEGYTVVATADGPRGIELYQKEKPEVVLLDVGLPTISGLEVLKEIRKIDTEAKVIMITGYPSAQTKEEAMKNGAFGFHAKPGVMSVLGVVVQHALATQVNSYVPRI